MIYFDLVGVTYAELKYNHSLPHVWDDTVGKAFVLQNVQFSIFTASAAGTVLGIIVEFSIFKLMSTCLHYLSYRSC